MVLRYPEFKPKEFKKIKPTPVNVKASTAVLRSSIPTVPKNCWNNSFVYLADVAKLLGVAWGELTYCEGWVAPPDGSLPIPIEHGWLELDGRVVEVTWRHSIHEVGRHRYFTGLSLSITDALDLLDNESRLLPLSQFSSQRLTRSQRLRYSLAGYNAHWLTMGKEPADFMFGLSEDSPFRRGVSK